MTWVIRMIRDMGAEVIGDLRGAISCLVRLCAVKTAAILSVTKALSSTHNVDAADILTNLQDYCKRAMERSLYYTIWAGPYELEDTAIDCAARVAIETDIHTLFDDRVCPLEPSVKDMLDGLHDECNRLAFVCGAMSSYAVDPESVHAAMIPLMQIYTDMVSQLMRPDAALVQVKRLASITARYVQLRAEGVGPTDAHKATVVESMARFNKA